MDLNRLFSGKTVERIFKKNPLLFLVVIIILVASGGIRLLDNNQPENTNINVGEETEFIDPAIYERGDEFKAIIDRVVDGDTIALSDNTKVRVLGIDTPETKDPRKPVQCFGQEAADKMQQLVLGREVTFISDNTQSNRDEYDRLLRYLYLGGEDVGALLVKEGYAYAYLAYPTIKTDEYKILENNAREKGLGLWSSETCNGLSDLADN
ncbi:MAG: thermonuclease family protein [Patescibacteria group bacterium]